jgi:thioredoxin-like negative regulator of GroEL
MEITTETIQRTMEAGYLAAISGMSAESIQIFSGIAAARPESELADIGLSFSYLCAGDVAEALRILSEEALRKNPESALAKSFVGLCLKQAGLNAEADSVLEEVAADSSDEAAREMAAALLKETFSA